MVNSVATYFRGLLLLRLPVIKRNAFHVVSIGEEVRIRNDGY
jgi:hypothetical protein